MIVRLALCLALAATSVPALAAPNRLRVAMPDDLRCPAPFDVVQALQHRFGADRVAEGQPGPDELGLRIAAFPDAIEIALAEGPTQRPTRRRLPFAEGGCADLAETLALIVDAWVRDLPWHGAGFLPDVPTPLAPAVPASAHTPAHTPTSTPTPVPERHSFFTPLTLRASGGGLLSAGGSNLSAIVSPAGALSADLALPLHLGAVLRAAFPADVSASDSSARALITIHRQLFDLAARYAFAAEDQSGLRLFAGVELQRFGIDTAGYSFSGQGSTTYNPALFLSALWQQNLVGRVSIFAQLSATLGPQLAFQVQEADAPAGEYTTVASSPVLFVDLSAGVALRLF